MPITPGVGHTFEGGVEVTGNRLSYSLQSGQGQGARLGASPLASVLNRDESGRLAAAFLQDRWLIGSRLLLVPGLRLTHFDRTGDRYTEPRLAATLFLTDTFKLKTAAGRYHQFTNRITREDVLQGNLIQADMFIPGVGGEFAETAAALLQTIQDRRLRVDRLVPIHGAVLPLSALEEAVENSL